MFSSSSPFIGGTTCQIHLLPPSPPLLFFPISLLLSLLSTNLSSSHGSQQHHHPSVGNALRCNRNPKRNCARLAILPCRPRRSASLSSTRELRRDGHAPVAFECAPHAPREEWMTEKEDESNRWAPCVDEEEDVKCDSEGMVPTL
jgi:hypothetical protein